MHQKYYGKVLKSKNKYVKSKSTPAQVLIRFKINLPHGEHIFKYNKSCIIKLFIVFYLANRAL